MLIISLRSYLHCKWSFFELYTTTATKKTLYVPISVTHCTRELSRRVLPRTPGAETPVIVGAFRTLMPMAFSDCCCFLTVSCYFFTSFTWFKASTTLPLQTPLRWWVWASRVSMHATRDTASIQMQPFFKWNHPWAFFWRQIHMLYLLLKMYVSHLAFGLGQPCMPSDDCMHVSEAFECKGVHICLKNIALEHVGGKFACSIFFCILLHNMCVSHFAFGLEQPCMP